MADVSRREALKLIGVGAAALGGGGITLLPGIAQASVDEKAPHWSLLDPLKAGDTVGDATVKTISGVFEGAVRVELIRSDGTHFSVEICARDDRPGAPIPIIRTKRYDLFIANGGKGNKRTQEEEGLSTYALAEVLKRNEAEVPAASLLTMRDRWAR